MELKITEFPKRDIVEIKDTYDQHCVYVSVRLYHEEPDYIQHLSQMIIDQRPSRDKWRATHIPRSVRG